MYEMHEARASGFSLSTIQPELPIKLFAFPTFVLKLGTPEAIASNKVTGEHSDFEDKIFKSNAFNNL